VLLKEGKIQIEYAWLDLPDSFIIFGIRNTTYSSIFKIEHLILLVG